MSLAQALQPDDGEGVAEVTSDSGVQLTNEGDGELAYAAGTDASRVNDVEVSRRGRPARAQANDELLRDAAAALISRSGWDHLTLSGVARHADLTLGAIYSRFENKSELGLDLWTLRVLPAFRDLLHRVDAAIASRSADEFSVLLRESIDIGPMNRCFNELLQAATFDPLMRDVIFDDLQEALTPRLAIDPAASARNAYVLGVLIGASLLQPVAPMTPDALNQTAPQVWAALMDLSAPAPMDSARWLELVNWAPTSGDATIELIHNAFITTLAKSGYEHATINRVCRTAGISSGSLFSRFESKADVFADAYRTLMLAAIGQDAEAMLQVASEDNPHVAYAEYVVARLRPEHRDINIIHLEFLRLATSDAAFKTHWDEMQQLYREHYDEHYETKVGQESLATEQKFMRASARWGLRLLALGYPDLWKLPMDVVNVSLSRLPDYFQPRRPASTRPTAGNAGPQGPIAPRRRSGRALQNDTRLRQAALATIVELGWSDAALTHVAKAAGLTLGAVYSRYEDKNDMAVDLWRQHGGPVLAEAVDLGIRAVAQERDDAAWQQLLEPDELTSRARIVAMELATESLFNPDLFDEVQPEITSAIKKLLNAGLGGGNVLFWFAAAMGLLHFKSIDPALPGQVHSLDALRQKLWEVTACPTGCPGAVRAELHIDMPGDDPYERSLLEGAREVLSQRGFDHSTIAAICRRAGISSGSLFGRYATKVELIAECVRRSQVTRIQKQGEFQREALTDAPAALRASTYVAGVLSPWNRHNRRCFVEFSRVARTHDDARKAWITMLDELNSAFVREMPSLESITASSDAMTVMKATMWSLRLFCEFDSQLTDVCYCPALTALGQAVTPDR